MKDLIIHTAEVSLNYYLEKIDKDNKYLKTMVNNGIKDIYLLVSEKHLYYIKNNYFEKIKIYKELQENLKINTSQSLYIKFLRFDSQNQISFSQENFNKLNTKKVNDQRRESLLPLLYKQFNIHNPTIYVDRIIWESPFI